MGGLSEGSELNRGLSNNSQAMKCKQEKFITIIWGKKIGTIRSKSPPGLWAKVKTINRRRWSKLKLNIRICKVK